MQNYLAGLTISTILHIGLILSFTNFFKMDLIYSLKKIDPMPTYLIYEKSEPVLKKIRLNRIKEVEKEKLVASFPVIKINDPKAALESIAIKETLVSKEKKELLVSNIVDEISVYSNKIREQVMINWKQPVSAKPGMTSELTISLVPSGEIVDVKITKGSGNEAFDRSALTAVLKVRRFDGLNMKRKLFDDYFRVFTLVFSPRD